MTGGMPPSREQPRGSPQQAVWTNPNRLWMMPLVVAFACELRRGEEILSTGRLTIEQELAPGDELTIAGIPALVDEIGWVDGESRLLLKSALAPTGTARGLM
jgi:hypothetical protein